MTRLLSKSLKLAYLDRAVIKNLSVEIPDGRITALVGPNGSGKSTLLKGLARILKPRAGAAYLDGREIHRQATKSVARRLAILPQGPEAPAGLTVQELVSYGRFPYRKPLRGLDHEDREMVRRAIHTAELGDDADRPIGTLSGGERQRAWIAMALAQGTPFLLLDEPTTFLDLAHQVEILGLLRRLNQREGRTIVMAIHDLNHASRTADHMIALLKGEIVAGGSPREVMTPEILKKVFGITVDIIADPRSGLPLCVARGIDDDRGAMSVGSDEQ